MIIEGGTGNGFKAKVDSQNRLYTFSTSESEMHFASELGQAYSWTAVSADINTGDTALLLCNTDPTKKLHIDMVYMYADVPVQFKFHYPAYNASFTGTAVTGLNFNRASNNIALATCYADETANTFSAANVFLTMRSNELTTDQHGIELSFRNAVILGYHDSIAIDIIGESAAFEATIWGYYKPYDV
jgi:hypothetical protein